MEASLEVKVNEAKEKLEAESAERLKERPLALKTDLSFLVFLN